MTKDAEIAFLKRQLAQQEARPAHTPSEPTMKVSEKGGLSVYGLGRFPVTLYKEQWARLIAVAPKISAFIAANSHALKTKGA